MPRHDAEMKRPGYRSAMCTGIATRLGRARSGSVAGFRFRSDVRVQRPRPCASPLDDNTAANPRDRHDFTRDLIRPGICAGQFDRVAGEHLQRRSCRDRQRRASGNGGDTCGHGRHTRETACHHGGTEGAGDPTCRGIGHGTGPAADTDTGDRDADDSGANDTCRSCWSAGRSIKNSRASRGILERDSITNTAAVSKRLSRCPGLKLES